MASYVAAGATKLASDDQNAAMQSGYYPPPGPNGQYPPPPPQGYAAPPYAAPPPVANNGPQYATVDMSGAYSQPSSAGGYIWGAPAVGQAMAQGIEGDPAARQRIEAQAKLHELEIGDRMRFLRKVYGILFCQLALTCGISAAMMFAGYNFKVWLIQNFWFPWVLLVVCLITLFGLYAKWVLSLDLERARLTGESGADLGCDLLTRNRMASAW